MPERKIGKTALTPYIEWTKEEIIKMKSFHNADLFGILEYNLSEKQKFNLIYTYVDTARNYDKKFNPNPTDGIGYSFLHRIIQHNFLDLLQEYTHYLLNHREHISLSSKSIFGNILREDLNKNLDANKIIKDAFRNDLLHRCQNLAYPALAGFFKKIGLKIDHQSEACKAIQVLDFKDLYCLTLTCKDPNGNIVTIQKGAAIPKYNEEIANFLAS